MSRLTATTKRVQGILRTTRSGYELAAGSGDKCLGVWQVHMALTGLSEERREELIGALLEELGGERAKPIGDGRFHMRAEVSGSSLGVAYAHSASQFAYHLKRVGLNPQEILSSTVEISVEPTGRILESEEPRDIRSRLAHGASRLYHGLTLAAAEEYDIEARQVIGDHSFLTHCLIDQLGEEDEAKLIAWLDDHGMGRTGLSPGSFAIEVECVRVASPIGAVTMTGRKLHNLLSVLGPATRLRLLAKPL